MKSSDILRSRHLVGKANYGSMTPQLQIQITPLNWGIEYCLDLENNIPFNVGIKVGPVAVVAYFRCPCREDFTGRLESNDHTSVTMKKEDARQT
jgi:hypothetical protein